ncbi:MAG TPA: hypothetical protein VKT82_09665 [Ktedonobacterales bacterium]|nr:hypothetical protein [Ktedonobacterales bacterium]
MAHNKKKKKKRGPLKLRVMAEYGSSGIWGIGQVGVFRHAMIRHLDLGLPPELAQGFDEWIAEYTSRLYESADAFDVLAFNAKGRALAAALKGLLGPQSYIEYLPETEDGSLGAAEVISWNQENR